MSPMPSIAASMLDQPLELAPQQRLAAGQADLLDAERREDRRDARDLLEREQLRRAARNWKSWPNTSRGMQ